MPRPGTTKQYLQRVNRVWLYIQDNLDKKLTLEELAGIACLSPYHFHRVFTAFTGETTNQYIRRLKLERAARQLLYSTGDVTTIAIENGYGSHAAFTAAFKSRFGVTPTEFRQQPPDVCPKVLNNQTNGEETTMEYQIVNLEPRQVLYVRRHGPYMESAFQAWNELSKYAEKNDLLKANTESIGVFNDSAEVTEEHKMRYDACITVDNGIKPEGEFAFQTIAGGEYAKFVHKGPYQTLEDTYNKIMREWLPTQDKELREVPMWERYLNSDLMETDPDNLLTEIYIPIK